MNITKAIELLTLYEHAASSIPRDDLLLAQKLGIEALKRIIALRKMGYNLQAYELPGETEE